MFIGTKIQGKLRVDKFIWVVRLFKTRTLATQVVKENRVLIAGVPVKPSREIKIGDKIQFTKEGFIKTIKVLDFPKGRVSAKLVPDYILDATPKEDQEKNELLLISRSLNRRKGLGRPTKRERRELEDFFGDED